MRGWVLNVRLLLLTGLFLAITIPAAYAWHRYMVNVNATAFLTRAAAHEEQEEWRLAAEDLFRYLRLNPHDSAVQVRYAETLDRFAKDWQDKIRAAQAFAQAIALVEPDAETGQANDPASDIDLLKLRHRHMTLLMEVSDFTGGLARAESLLSVDPSDHVALRVKALCLYAQWQNLTKGSVAPVVDALLTANKANGGDVEVATALAYLYRSELHEPSKEQRDLAADEIVNRMVDQSERRSDALLARHEYRLRYQLAGAAEDLELARAADPEGVNVEVHLASARQAYQDRQFDAAKKHFQRAIEIAPNDRRGYHGLTKVHEAAGEPELALSIIQKLLDKLDRADITTVATYIELQLQSTYFHLQLKDQGKATAALDEIDELLKKSVDPRQSTWHANVARLRGEIALAKDEHLAAIPYFQRALALQDTAAGSTSATSADLLSRLGHCYASQHQWDQAATAYQQAADLQPSRADLRTAAASAWERSGQIDRAIRQYELALAVDRKHTSAAVAYVNVLLKRQLSSPSSQRDWSTFDAALQSAKELVSDSAELDLLAAKSAMARSQVGQAVESLQHAEASAKGSSAILSQVMLLYEDLGLSVDANRLLADIRQNGASSTQALLLEVELLSRRGKHQDAAAKLMATIAATPQADNKRALRLRLVTLYLAQGNKTAARKELAELAGDSVGDLQVLQLLTELTLDAGDSAEASRLISRIRQIEGAEGTFWRLYEAQTLLTQAAAEKDSKKASALIDRATQLHNEIKRLRSNWSLAYLLESRLALMSAVPDDQTAIEALMQAIRMGERRIEVVQQLVGLLYRNYRFAEASAYLDRFRDAGNLPAELTALGMAVDVQQGNLDRAIQAAQEQLDEGPGDAANHMRLGQLMAMESLGDEDAKATRLTAAEGHLKRACELAPHEVSTASALLAFYLSNQRWTDARGLLTEMQQKEAVPAADRLYFAAQGFGVLSSLKQPDATADLENAKKYYKQVMQAAPDRAAVFLGAARFYANHDVGEAERCARKALSLDPSNSVARRTLVGLLANQADSERDMNEALKLLEGAGDRVADAVDQSIKARLLLKRGGSEHRQQAKELLESVVGGSQQATAIDRLLLARLYEAQGSSGVQQARAQYRSLVAGDQPSAEHLAVYVDHLLRTGGAPDEEISARLEQLDKLEPASSHYRTMSLKARWLKHENDTAAIKSLVDKFAADRVAKAENRVDQGRVWITMANLYKSIELPQEAERCFRAAIEREASLYPTLATWLAQEHRVPEAVALCTEAAMNDATPRAAMTLAAVLAMGQGDAADHRNAEPIFAKALMQHPRHAALLFSLATVRLLAGDDVEAIELLRRCLELNPNNLQAINNLALALAEKPHAQRESVELIDRAIDIAGASPELIDTKGWILLVQNKPSEAETLFREALSIPPGDPRFHFHLALSLYGQNKPEEAGEALAKANELNLADSLLSPNEQVRLKELEKSLD